MGEKSPTKREEKDMEIKNRFTCNTIYEAEVDSIKILVEMAIEAKADLSEANLSGADLDFSSGLQFRCNSFGFKAGKRLAAQIAYHFCRIDFSGCEEAEKSQEDLKALANKFHRVEECGEIK